MVNSRDGLTTTAGKTVVAPVRCVENSAIADMLAEWQLILRTHWNYVTTIHSVAMILTDSEAWQTPLEMVLGSSEFSIVDRP